MVSSLFNRRRMLPSLLSAVLLLAGVTTSNPLRRRATTISPMISTNFPDPSIIQDTNGTWYAFATNNGADQNVPIATAPSPGGPWTVHVDLNIFPMVGAWSNGANVWAPDVRIIGSTYVLYYSANDAASPAQHCVGAATASTITGPYTAVATPIACNVTAGGAIDSSGFTDTDGTHYVVYKVDGSSIGKGGDCGNAIPPIIPTPIMLQQLADDGITPVGSPVELLDRTAADGPLIEAPDIILVNGIYIMFFSSNCFNSPLYDINYATATALKGPWTRSSAPLAATNNPFEITSPGGATATTDGKALVFHANCAAGRCMFESPITISGTTVTFS